METDQKNLWINFRNFKNECCLQISERELAESYSIKEIKIKHFSLSLTKVCAVILDKFGHNYRSVLHLNFEQAAIVENDCDCTQSHDCNHQIALAIYLEQHLQELLFHFFQEENRERQQYSEQEELFIQKISSPFQSKGFSALVTGNQKQLLSEYVDAIKILSHSPFFLSKNSIENNQCELSLIFFEREENHIYFLPNFCFPFPSRTLSSIYFHSFFQYITEQSADKYRSSQYSAFFSPHFPTQRSLEILHTLKGRSSLFCKKGENLGKISLDVFTELMQTAVSRVLKQMKDVKEQNVLPLASFYKDTLDRPLLVSPQIVSIHYIFEVVKISYPRLLLKPVFHLSGRQVALDEILLLLGSVPLLLYQRTFYSFPSHITSMHLAQLESLRNMSIPFPLMGTFIRESLSRLLQFGELSNPELLNQFEKIDREEEKVLGKCYLKQGEEELSASLYFVYRGKEIPICFEELTFEHLQSFFEEERLFVRKIYGEGRIIRQLFSDFFFDRELRTYTLKSEKKIIQFMTQTVPLYHSKIKFHLSGELSERFIYEKTRVTISLSSCNQEGMFSLNMKVEGELEGLGKRVVRKCIDREKFFVAKREKERRGTQFSFIEEIGDRDGESIKWIIFSPQRAREWMQLFEDLGIDTLKTMCIRRPLWYLFSLCQGETFFSSSLSIAPSLKSLIARIRGRELSKVRLPALGKNSLRPYQREGVIWLHTLQNLHLNAILADDMGLGKTVQAIIALSLYHRTQTEIPSLIVCPTSLTKNWAREWKQFAPHLQTQIMEGFPEERESYLKEIHQYDILIVSYGILQRDIEKYREILFGYVVLDEGQFIKNRMTESAKSAKLLQAKHKLILSGTPVENHVAEMWSLFDFLMPGFLGSYTEFRKKYVQCEEGEERDVALSLLKNKTTPFILRRLKKEVLCELPPISEMTYYCALSEDQQELYFTYAREMQKKLSHLVEKEGYHRAKPHILASLIRLKQICCHPALFEKDLHSQKRSEKYEMFRQLLDNLIKNDHRVVIFSQYTAMLQIMRRDFAKYHVPLYYLDGQTKRRIELVDQFNKESGAALFLISLKAGGTGLNLVGADTVFHYDMWWNPAVHRQATDRVYRMGQENPVSAYNLVTLGTIEEEILSLQKKKKNLMESFQGEEDLLCKLKWKELFSI